MRISTAHKFNTHFVDITVEITSILTIYKCFKNQLHDFHTKLTWRSKFLRFTSVPSPKFSSSAIGLYLCCIGVVKSHIFKAGNRFLSMLHRPKYFKLSRFEA